MCLWACFLCAWTDSTDLRLSGQGRRYHAALWAFVMERSGALATVLRRNPGLARDPATLYGRAEEIVRKQTNQ